MKSEQVESLSARSSIDTTLSKCYSELNFKRKLNESNSDCFRNKIKTQINRNKRRIKNMSTLMNELSSDKQSLFKLKKELAISSTDKIDTCINKLTHSVSTIFNYYEQTIEEKNSEICYLNGLHRQEENNKLHVFKESQCTSNYKTMEENFRRNVYEERNKEFERCISDSDQMYFHTQNLMKQLAEKCTRKTVQIKELKKEISDHKTQLYLLNVEKTEINNSLEVASKSRCGDEDRFQKIKTAQLHLSKDVKRMTNEMNHMQRHEKKLKEQIIEFENDKKQLSSELESELKEIKRIQLKLNAYSSTIIKNKQLSDSVNMDKSRLESYLNLEKETKQELLSVVNKKRKEIECYRRASKDFGSKSLINPYDNVSSSEDDKSLKPSNSQIIPDDLSEYGIENKQQFEKDQVKSISANTADDVTMATKRSAGHQSDWNDIRSSVEEFPPALSDRKIESKNEPAKNDREVNEYEFIISTISQHRRFEDIPEVPEEISSTNITPRRPEDQNEEIGEIEIINVNKKSPFAIKRFDQDKEINISNDDKMNISIVSSVESNPDEEYIMSPNNYSNSNVSFSSSNFKTDERETNFKTKVPLIPKLNLSKVKSPFENSKDIFSLNLSIISGNQSVNDTIGFNTNSCAKENRKATLPNVIEHKRHESTKVTLHRLIKKQITSNVDKGFCDSFINDANVITEMIINQPNDEEKNSNLDMTFERSESIQDEDFWKQDQFYKKQAIKDAFKKSHWNFGSKRNRKSKAQSIHY